MFAMEHLCSLIIYFLLYTENTPGSDVYRPVIHLYREIHALSLV